jgi:hypothetical protein
MVPRLVPAVPLTDTGVPAVVVGPVVLYPHLEGLFPETVISGVAGNAAPLRLAKTLTWSVASAPFDEFVEVLEI